MKQTMANWFKAVSDETRLTILELLIQGETCGCTLIDKLDITQPTMSYHLRYLTDSGLIMSYKEGVWKKHHVNMEAIEAMISFLTKLKATKVACTDDQNCI